MLEGTLTLLVEDEPRELGRGELARVAPEVRRQLVNRGTEPLSAARGRRRAPRTRAATAAPTSRGTRTGEGSPPADVPLPEDLEVG